MVFQTLEDAEVLRRITSMLVFVRISRNRRWRGGIKPVHIVVLVLTRDYLFSLTVAK